MAEQRLLPGFYTIENKKNGRIDAGATLDVPVVAALSGATWYIDRLNKDGYSIKLTSKRPHELPNDFLPTLEESDLLYANAPQVHEWYIRGRAPYYVIFKQHAASQFGVWVLQINVNPGKQVDVLRTTRPQDQTLLQTLLDNESVSEDIFRRIPEDWLWHIQTAHVPKILWIGCSDARVPESVARSPTQIFVHRNIANQFHLTDANAGSVLTYGLTGIKNDPITEIHVVGHSDCGGVNACHAAANGKDVGIPPSSILWTWLGPLRLLADSYKSQPPINLARENVRVQVRNVRETLRRLGVTRPVVVKGYIYLIGENRPEPVE